MAVEIVFSTEMSRGIDPETAVLTSYLTRGFSPSHHQSKNAIPEREQIFSFWLKIMTADVMQMGIRILNYLDNWLILAQSQAVLTSHKTFLLSHLHCLGLWVNFAKSILSPSLWVSFLGTVIDSVQMAATIATA